MLVLLDCPDTQPSVDESEYSDIIDTIDADGMITVYVNSGLGVDYDWNYIMGKLIASIYTSNASRRHYFCSLSS